MKVFDRQYVSDHIALDQSEPDVGLLLSVDKEAEARRARLQKLDEDRARVDL